MRVVAIATVSLLGGLAMVSGAAQMDAFHWVNPLPATAHPGLHHGTFFSSSMGLEVGYSVYLPPGYEEADRTGRRYPVVYWLPGGRSGRELVHPAVVEHWDRQIRSGQVGPRLYVIVNGGPLNYYDHDGSLGETSFVRELIPHVDRTFRTVAKRTGRALEGFSAGGRGTARILFKYPELFCSGAPLSGGHQYEREASLNGGRVALGSEILRLDDPRNNSWDLARFHAARNGSPSLRILVAVGAADQNYTANLEWMNHLQALGIRFSSRIAPDVPHNAARLYEAIGDEIIQFHEACFSGAEARVSPRRQERVRAPAQVE